VATDVEMLPGWEAELVDLLRPAMSRFVGRVASNARANGPVETGRLLSSLYSRVNADGSGEVGVTARYGIWVHEGTGVYGPRHQRISPVRAPFLVFVPRGAGHRIFARSTAGQRPQPFLVEALHAELAAGFG